MKKKKGFSLILTLVIFALMIGAGVYVYSLILDVYKKTYDNAKCDIRLIIQKSNSVNSDEVAKVEVVDRNKNPVLSIEKSKLEPSVLMKNQKYSVEIINDNDGKIQLNLKDSSNNLLDNWQVVNKINISEGVVVLQMETDVDVSLDVKAVNKVEDNILYVYFTKIKSNMDKDEIIKYSFQSEGGIIQTYSNVYKKVDN